MSSFLNTINELEELLGGVTPGEWEKDGYSISSGEYNAFTSCRSWTDAKFIALSRNSLPQLLAMARWAEENGWNDRLEKGTCCGTHSPFGKCGRGTKTGCNGAHCRCMNLDGKCGNMHGVDCKEHYEHVENV